MLTAELPSVFRAAHPWAVFARSFADRDPPAYGDFGQWATLVWLATRAGEYARKAIARGLATFTPEPTWGRNETRETTLTWALQYGWLKEAMTPDERTTWAKRLNRRCELILTPFGTGWGTSLGDSDETVGHYFGLALTDAVLGTTYLTDPTAGTKPADMREAIRGYCAKAKGGEWIESSSYNLGTVQLLLLGAYAHGIEKYPDVATFAMELAEQLRWQLTPDLKDAVQWGDTQNPHDPQWSLRVGLWGIVAGLTGDPGGHLRALIAAITDGKDPYPTYWSELYRVLWVYDPRPPAGPVVPPTGFRVTGPAVGLAIHRGPNHLFACRFAGRTGVDHESEAFGDVRLWLNGEWVLGHPLGYGAFPEAHNAGLVAGLGAMTERTMTAVETPTGCTVTGRTSGPYFDPPYRVPSFLDGWEREVRFEAPNRLAVRDTFRGSVPDPTAYPASWPYVPDRIRKAPALWCAVYHAPVEPASVTGGFTWTTLGGQRVTVTGPDGITEKVTRENTLGNFYDTELGWRVVFRSNATPAELVTTVAVGDVTPQPPPPPAPEWVEVGRSARTMFGDSHATETVLLERRAV